MLLASSAPIRKSNENLCNLLLIKLRVTYLFASFNTFRCLGLKSVVYITEISGNHSIHIYAINSFANNIPRTINKTGWQPWHERGGGAGCVPPVGCVACLALFSERWGLVRWGSRCSVLEPVNRDIVPCLTYFFPGRSLHCTRAPTPAGHVWCHSTRWRHCTDVGQFHSKISAVVQDRPAGTHRRGGSVATAMVIHTLILCKLCAKIYNNLIIGQHKL